jgi:antitoxin component YwqK of YwqJK toxin-antitoxin module
MRTERRKRNAHWMKNWTRIVRSWNENGEKETECTFKDGEKLDEIVTEWYENGTKKAEHTYKDGKLDGLVTEWYKNGKIKRPIFLI